jgi:hypothetical protein
LRLPPSRHVLPNEDKTDRRWHSPANREIAGKPVILVAHFVAQIGHVTTIVDARVSVDRDAQVGGQGVFMFGGVRPMSSENGLPLAIQGLRKWRPNKSVVHDSRVAFSTIKGCEN